MDASETLKSPLLEGESWSDEGEGAGARGASSGSGGGGGGPRNDRTELPSWLKEENDAQHVAAVNGDNSAAASATEAGSSTSWADDGAAAASSDTSRVAWHADEPDCATTTIGRSGSDLPKIVLGMRIANVATAVLLMASSISVMTMVLAWPPTSLARWVLAAYAALGGLLLLCLESPFSFLRTRIALNFGFLYDPVLRFVFNSLLCSIAWSFRTIPGDVTVAALGVMAPANAYVLCAHSSYGAERDVALEEEERLIAARAREERRRAVREIAARWIESDA